MPYKDLDRRRRTDCDGRNRTGPRPSRVLCRIRRQRAGPLKGKVTKFEWINPHAWIHMETRPPAARPKIGWSRAARRTPCSAAASPAIRSTGTVIVVSGYQAKDGRMRANGRDITFPDGRTLFMGSSGTGAPRDGKDPNERPKPKGL